MTFEEFADARLAAVLRFASVLTGDRALAEDVVQEVLIRAHARWRKIGRLDSPESYIRRMIVNEFISSKRRTWRFVPSGTDMAAAIVPDHAARHSERDALLAEIGKLPRRQRAVLVLRYYDGSPTPGSRTCSAARRARSVVMRPGRSPLCASSCARPRSSRREPDEDRRRPVVVSLLPGGPAAPGGTASQRHGQAPPVTTLRAKLLAAFESAGGQIMYERTTGYSDGGGAGTENWFYPVGARVGQQVRSRAVVLNAHGTPVQDIESLFVMPAPGSAPPAGMPGLAEKEKRVPGMLVATGEIIDVEYGTQTWSNQKDQVIFPDDPAALRNEIASGHWTAARPADLDGRKAIEVTWQKAHNGTVLLTTHFWFDARTYLPLREESSYLIGSPGHYRVATMRGDFELLPATTANLAQLKPVIPSGFRKTSTVEMPSKTP